MADRTSSETSKNGRVGILASRVPKWCTAAVSTSPPNVSFDPTTAASSSEGYAARVDPSLADSPIAHVDQVAESDLPLNRIVASAGVSAWLSSAGPAADLWSRPSLGAFHPIAVLCSWPFVLSTAGSNASANFSSAAGRLASTTPISRNRPPSVASRAWPSSRRPLYPTATTRFGTALRRRPIAGSSTRSSPADSRFRPLFGGGDGDAGVFCLEGGEAGHEPLLGDRLDGDDPHPTGPAALAFGVRAPGVRPRGHGPAGRLVRRPRSGESSAAASGRRAM